MTLLLLGLWAGCSEKDSTNTAQETDVEPTENSETEEPFGDTMVLTTGEAIVLEHETLLDNVHAAWFSDGHLLAQTEDGLWFRDVSGDTCNDNRADINVAA